MGQYSLSELQASYVDDKEKKNVVVINNWGVDLRKLEKVSEGYIRSQSIGEPSRDAFNFERALNTYCASLLKRDIPFDRIVATGKPGIVITGIKHREILEDFIKRNYENNKNKNVNSSDFKWDEYDFMRNIKNLTVSDVLYGYVPLNFTFEPYITIHTKNDSTSMPTLTYLGIENDNEIKFSSVVPLDSFVDRLNEDGYHLLYERNNFTVSEYEISSYDEYFSHFKNGLIFDRLIMKVDVANENMKR